MDSVNHRFHDLFAQLGLPNDAASIGQFIAAHAPLPGGMRLPEAPFWTATQAAFLRESCAQDADWAELVDQLNAALHRT